MKRRGFITSLFGAFVAATLPKPKIPASSSTVRLPKPRQEYEAAFAKSGFKIGDTITIRKPTRYVGRTASDKIEAENFTDVERWTVIG